MAPPRLEAVVANVSPHAEKPMPLLLHDTVHAFLPTDKRFEFGALIPNVSHATVVVAGLHVGDGALEAFLNHPAARGLLGERARTGDQFRATFPNGLAQHAYGDRFVTIGDAAGLVRPFKGKGIYAAAITGLRAARTMLEVGISRQAFGHYRAECQDLVTDVQYGRLVRRLALLLAKGFSFDPVLARARQDPGLRRALFLAVSGHGTSREIFWLGARPRTALGLALACAS
jgi:flavin-dependent dehydrogenase